MGQKTSVVDGSMVSIPTSPIPSLLSMIRNWPRKHTITSTPILLLWMRLDTTFVSYPILRPLTQVRPPFLFRPACPRQTLMAIAESLMVMKMARHCRTWVPTSIYPMPAVIPLHLLPQTPRLWPRRMPGWTMNIMSRITRIFRNIMWEIPFSSTEAAHGMKTVIH